MAVRPSEDVTYFVVGSKIDSFLDGILLKLAIFVIEHIVIFRIYCLGVGVAGNASSQSICS
jgi:hypothetical protein